MNDFNNPTLRMLSWRQMSLWLSGTVQKLTLTIINCTGNQSQMQQLYSHILETSRKNPGIQHELSLSHRKVVDPAVPAGSLLMKSCFNSKEDWETGFSKKFLERGFLTWCLFSFPRMPVATVLYLSCPVPSSLSQDPVHYWDTATFLSLLGATTPTFVCRRIC